MPAYRIVFDAGEGEAYWKPEEDADGNLYASSNAETQQIITPERHRGWDAEQLRSDLLAAGTQVLSRRAEPG